MQDNYKSFDNLETTFGKSTVIQDRVSLVASHMYKQYLDFNNAANNGYQVFMEINKEVQIIADLLKQSFAARNIQTQNISVQTDDDKMAVMLNIMWHKISFSIRSNHPQGTLLYPQALERERGKNPMMSYRIMAIKGNYNELIKNSDKDEMDILLENEIASLFVSADKTQPAIMTVRHLLNKELSLNIADASKEFVLNVLESVCRGGILHKMSGDIKQFNF